MKVITGFNDTRGNEEDFAITPYLSLVYLNKRWKVFGICITWGYWSVYIALGFNTPKTTPFLINHNKSRLKRNVTKG